MASGSRSGRRKVAYFYDQEVGNFYYSQHHPMKPHRIRMTHDLIVNYGLFNKLEIFRPSLAKESDMTKFHSDDYVSFLKLITPDNTKEYAEQLQIFNVGEDCPVFDGLYQFCQISSGGSIDGAVRLNSKSCDVAINWAGGLHHAKKSKASGFCYVNDIVLSILELLKYHQRVLYIDVDIHHGDGVEEAFYTTDRVMTVSFHKFGDYFPGTGHVNDIGIHEGKYYSLNFPLKDGIDDETYEIYFKSIVDMVMKWYQPNAVVLQCGCDSLAGDRLGCFNLSLKGHAMCVKYVQSFGLPTLILGGGGYTIRNVARCWTYETACAVGSELHEELPYNDYYEYYGPDYRLNIPATNMENMNTRDYLDKIRMVLTENLRNLPAAPSVPLQNVPPDLMSYSSDEDEEDQDVRVTQKAMDRKIAREDEFSDSDDEDGRRDARNHNE
eukprot:TRINITY_DN1903_c0_g1_i1.p1 TRINITY_DN1903_c0_g1~~TRINITY_DN1903_c0_g1_i1.p1  ORF type:complete len:438 (-),score=95.00 TRINITY_DN1903_c0_g1_i1:231-1544(-)